MRDLAHTFGFFYGFVDPFKRKHINVDWEFAYNRNANLYHEPSWKEYFKVVLSGAHR